jgi:hypothetical protein
VQFPFPVGRRISQILKAATATCSFAKEFRANPKNRSINGMKWIKNSQGNCAKNWLSSKEFCNSRFLMLSN